MQEKYKYLIIGGGIAGTTAAETLRKNDNEANIAIISDEPRMYSRIMLSKSNFFLEKIPFDSIWLKEEKWYIDNRIDFIGDTLATKLDTQNKTVKLKDDKILQYEKLLLATGGEAREWPLPGTDKKGICYVRDLSQVKILMDSVRSSKQAIAIGSGFVSFEMCEMMKKAGVEEITLIMREPYYWYPVLDEESGKMIEGAMIKGGIKIIRENEVKEILGDNSSNSSGQERISGVVLKDGTEIPCQTAVIGIGLSCNLDWIKNAGVETNKGILANEYLETNLPDIYTAGDVAEFNDIILGERVQLGNWINAQKQGQVAAFNMLGKREIFRMVSFYNATGFGLSISMSGDPCPKNICNVIKRGSSNLNEAQGFTRIIIDQNNEIVGGTFINRPQDMAPVNKLIESNFKISSHESELANPNFDLKQLIN
ncbi:MAG: FAD-dependent oxidoreductase [Candidatus Zambryskibacteria bacterium]|nr:FAD-dependent oxidoreductase [Candidatus Zambryskibacteria bacterium]